MLEVFTTDVVCTSPAPRTRLFTDNNKKGEDLDHVLDMIGHGWVWSEMI